MKPNNISELQDIVHVHMRLTPSGGRTKPALMLREAGITQVDLTELSGMISYNPGEYTFSALSGTSLKEINQNLSHHGQYLPFDPLFVEQGATIGGAVSSGLSGPARYRYGGIRDFILGIQYIDGHGDLIRSGGQVVKNAAGFDLSKLMIGSLGAYGALIECSFKVFPKPELTTTLIVSFSEFEDALEKMIELTKLQMEILALDLFPKTERSSLLVRVGGISDSMPVRIDKLQEVTGNGKILAGEEEDKLWLDITEFKWLGSGDILVKIPVTAKKVSDLENSICGSSSKRHYSVGGNVAWVAWSNSISELDQILKKLELSGLVIIGQVSSPRLGVKRSNLFATKVKQALDPMNRWVEV